MSEIAESERAKIGIKGRELYGVAENVFEGDHDNS